MKKEGETTKKQTKTISLFYYLKKTRFFFCINMASYVMDYKIPTGNSQQPVQIKHQNESNMSHSKPTNEQNSSSPP